MTAFLLIHGHYLGGWCWDAVRERLHHSGHETIAPTLRGMGERENEGGPQTGLSVHASELSDLLDQSSAPVCVVGHSYAGLVVDALLSNRPNRVSSALYLDAAISKHGESLFDQRGDVSAVIREAAAGFNGWAVPPPPSQALGVEGPELQAHVDRRLTSVPLRTLEEPLHAPNVEQWRGPRTYVCCTGFPLSKPVADRLRGMPGWEVEELEAGHLAMITHPEAVAGAILRAAERAG